MLARHIPFLGWRQLPADLCEFEIAHFFTLKPVDIRAVRSRYKESLRLGAALQLGFLTMCGRPLSALQHRIIIPGRRRLSELAGEAVKAVESDAVEVIERGIPAATRARWSAALSQSIGDTHLTLLEYLQEPPGKLSPSTIEKQFDKVVRLRDLGVSRHIVAAFTPAQQQAYAQEMRRRRPSRSAQLREPRKTIELGSFLQHALFEHTDLLIPLVAGF